MTQLGRVVLVRHGETEWTISGQHTGTTDIPLTDKGRREAQLLGPRLKPEHFGKVLTSPLVRSVETCRLAGFGGIAETDETLREWNYGEYEGRRTEEIRTQRPGWSIWADGAPGGENIEEVSKRANEIIKRTRDLNADVLIFSHGHFSRVLAALWCGMPGTIGKSLALSPASVSVLGWERQTPVIRLWNSANDPEGPLSK